MKLEQIYEPKKIQVNQTTGSQVIAEASENNHSKPQVCSTYVPYVHDHKKAISRCFEHKGVYSTGNLFHHCSDVCVCVTDIFYEGPHGHQGWCS